MQCDPGSPGSSELRGAGRQAADRAGRRSTTQPVNLTDLFEIWNVPTRDRLTVLLSELGIATAGRGEDINAILRRANPALAAGPHGHRRCSRTSSASAARGASTPPTRAVAGARPQHRQLAARCCAAPLGAHAGPADHAGDLRAHGRAAAPAAARRHGRRSRELDARRRGRHPAARAARTARRPR